MATSTTRSVGDDDALLGLLATPFQPGGGEALWQVEAEVGEDFGFLGAGDVGAELGQGLLDALAVLED